MECDSILKDFLTNERTKLMIYTCDSCRFTFTRVGKVSDCPDCDKPFIREATEKEKNDYVKYQEEKDHIDKRPVKSEQMIQRGAL